VRPLVPPAAVRTAGLVLLAGCAWLVSAANDSPDANIGLGILLLSALVLAVVVWAAVDGVRTARQGRPDRDGLVVWLLTAAAFGLLTAAATGVGVAVTGGADGAVPLGALLSASFTWGGFVAVPAALAYGLARTLTDLRRGRSLGRRG
jgi:hypothetical protein